MTKLQQGDKIKHYQINKKIGGGGFAIAYRVNDSRNGQTKVLKVLNSERALDEKSLQWFKQEAEILQKLNHPGIPSVQQDDGYFTHNLVDSQPPLHCFVMEWIEGGSLDNYVKKKSKIEEKQAIDWLKQLVNILDVVHKNKLIHRDIKPSNILFRYKDETLVLIDFGIVRAVSQTLHDKQERGIDLTKVGTLDYQAPEVWRGEVCMQSDFFSLGRTFVFLTTGKPIGEFARDEQGNLNWHDYAPQLLPQFKKLLDCLMQQDPNKRPPDTQALLDRLNTHDFAVDKAETTHVDTQSTKRSRQVLAQLPQKALVAFASAALSTIAIVGLRYVGVLQSAELAVFDQMMRSRAQSNAEDERMLIVKITDEDYKKYEKQSRSGDSSISDEALLKLLKILKRDQARIIGLDMIRDFPTRTPDLKKLLKTSEILYGICELPSADGQGAIDQAPELSQVGFANVPYDGKGAKVIRRQRLAMDIAPTGCQEKNSFAVRLAFDYLHQQNKSLSKKRNCNSPWQLGQAHLSFLKAGQTGFYSQNDLDGANCEILLNTRPNSSTEKNFLTVTLSQVLDGKVDPKNSIAGRIVLIGSSVSSFKDTGWVMPSQSDQEIPGVFIQAEMVSHLVSIGMGERSMLRFWWLWQDALWIGGWALLSSIVILIWRSRPVFTAVGVLGLTGLSVIVSWFFFLQLGILVTSVPTALAILLSGLSGLTYRQHVRQTYRL
jgi:CHASE2 domain-containing sensor protein